MLTKIMPELPFDDVTAAVNYYKNVLGFSINYQQADIGVMDRDAVRVLLVARTDRHTGIGSTYVYVDDADALYHRAVAAGATAMTPPTDQSYGDRVGSVKDSTGTIWYIARPAM